MIVDITFKQNKITMGTECSKFSIEHESRILSLYRPIGPTNTELVVSIYNMDTIREIQVTYNEANEESQE